MDKIDLDGLLSRLQEIEELMEFPTLDGHVERASKLALSIARGARSGAILNLAMLLISEAHALRASALPLGPDRSRINEALKELRRALHAARDMDSSA